ncbi:hypothetical protein V3H18_16440 [Methylocystis sp. 9N]|uniref:DUF2946 domain-containing protein n=1 Tax=Methylocystis borbori TaxID=3118750 RepID=A0ABU7XLV8_9HYPH
MSLSSLRALLLALAMVVQAIAGGASLAQAAPPSPERAFAAPCHERYAPDDSGPAEKSGHHRHCQSCCLCAEPWHAWVADWTHDASAPVDYALIDFGATDFSSPAARAVRSHCARAPPAARA